VATYPPGSGPRANFGQRLVAALIDGIIVGVVGFVVGIIVRNELSGLLSLALGVAYYGWLEGSPSGQTIGKRMLGIRVYDLRQGGPIGTGRAIGRYFARILSAIPCLLGYFWMLWDPQKQTWHDKIVGSIVVPVSSYPVDNWPG
jgi:uncharacterized RDD family membrane protein YckC